MIKRLYVDNYKCLVNFEAIFSELTLFMGPNGVGKSSVHDVVFGLRQLLDGTARVSDAELFPTSTLTRWKEQKVQVIELAVSLDGDSDLIYRLEVEHELKSRRAHIILERLSADGKPLFEFKSGEVRLYGDDHSEGAVYPADGSESAMARLGERQDNKRLSRFLDFMRKIIVCGFYPKNFVAESSSEDALLHRDGRNFAAWYRHIFQERPDLVPDYINALRETIDGFSGIRLEKIGQDTRAFMVIFEEDDKRYELRLDELSDGERALIALYALVFVTANQGYTLFLDEPDNYLALPEIQPWLIELSDACGEKLPQAVISSHHSELIDYLGAEKGLLFKRETSGVVVAHPVQYRDADGLKLSELVARGWEK
ncbi:AAA family ATPase [Myxococcota bacterium]|nr:AAA family ATPase [Myxococcota bacterium]